VEVHRHVRPDQLDRAPDEVGDRLRRGDPERVDDDHLARARLDGGRVDPLVEVGLGAGRVDAEEGGVDPVLGGEAHRALDPAEHRLAVDADRLELQVGDRRLDHRGRHAELDERLEVGRHCAREAPNLRGESGRGDQLDRAPVVVRDAREAGLDPLDPESVEELRDLELLLRVEDDPDRLLAVSQRRVVETDRAADAVAVVQRSRPDQVAHTRTTPSGNDDSFSTPVAVTRKLSSTRKPPPPSQ
jgi:hypothetical protein